MDAIEAIITRKSVRNFADKEVEEDKVELLLKAAMAAPSAVNKQPWKFVVVSNKDKIEDIKKAMPFGKYNAPLIIIPCINDLATIPLPHDLANCDLSAATENILIMSNAIGLGAVWCAIYPSKGQIKKIRKVLDLGATLSPFSCIFIGYPSENDKSKVKDKYKESNIIAIKS